MKKNLRWMAMILACLFVLTSVVACNSPAAKPQAAAPAAAAPVVAQSKYPEKPFEMLVPMSAGGGSDVFIRSLVKIIADNKLSPQPIVVVNKPGGSGSIGWTYVAKDHKGDPYELSTVSSSFYTVPLGGKSPVSYKDFTHIMTLCVDPGLLLVSAESKYKTLDDLIKDAKANPEKISAAGSSGLSTDAIAFYSLQEKSGAKMKYVPFGGGGEVMTSILGQHTTFGFLGPSEASGQIEAGKLRVLAVTTEKRLSGDLKDIPTLKESGFDIVVAEKRGIVAPPGISPEQIKYLEDMFTKAIATPEWKKFLAANFMEEYIMNSEQFTKESANISANFQKYLDVVGK